MPAAGEASSTAAVIGIGATPQGVHPASSSDDLAVAAAKLALDDAGISKSEIDGLVTCKTITGRGGKDTTIGQLLGLNIGFSQSLDYGSCNFSIHLATLAIRAGLARTVLLTYGTNQRSADGAFSSAMNETESHSGKVPISVWTALMFQRHRHLYGMTEEQLGAVTVAQRLWASLNPLAARPDPITVQDYLATPYLVEPIRALDVSPFDDGGVAIVIAATDRAADFRHRPIYIRGIAEIAELRVLQNRDNIDRRWVSKVAHPVFAAAGLERSDIDIVSIQDPGSMWVIQILEALGFVGPGEAGAFIAEGRTGPLGELPLNTSGGHLAESYMWGWLHTAELVAQLRGAAGLRQVLDAQTAIHCSAMLNVKAAATIYGTER